MQLIMFKSMFFSICCKLINTAQEIVPAVNFIHVTCVTLLSFAARLILIRTVQGIALINNFVMGVYHITAPQSAQKQKVLNSGVDNA